MATTSTFNDQPIATHNDVSVTGYEVSQYAAALGRVLFSLIFIFSGFSHFQPSTMAYGASMGVPIPGVLVPLAGIMILIGGLSIAFGYQARWGALLIALFLIPTTLVMHNFWNYADPIMHQMQMVNFMKNIALLGASFLIMHFGSGPVSVDSYLLRHPSRER